MYIVPTDGYVYINCDVAGAIHIRYSNIVDIPIQVPPISNGAINNAAFIKKGLGVYVAFNASATVKIARFYKCI